VRPTEDSEATVRIVERETEPRPTVKHQPATHRQAIHTLIAGEAGVEIKTEIVGSEEFEWGSEQWDLVVLSYVSSREWVETIHRALRPGGLVMLEAFHDDATKNSSIGRGVVFDTNELLERFSDFRILDYEDTTAAADFGKGETRVVRLLAMKESRNTP